MTKPFLRSGSLDTVLPLGENGQPVYLSALQLRETLRLRKQTAIADCLAIPQPNEAGDRLDWYSPVPGKVSSWAAANESARAHALHQLIACQQAAAVLCQKAQTSEKSSQKLFGALLAKAIQFPDQNFVYLVGGKPVLTFWGFVSLDKKSRQDALDCLRLSEESEPLPIAKYTAPVITPVNPVAAVETPRPAPVAEPTVALPVEAPPVAAAPVQSPAVPVQPPAPVKNPLLRYGWMLPAPALLVILGIQLQGYVNSSKTDARETRPQPAKTEQPAAPKAQKNSAASPAAQPVPETHVTSLTDAQHTTENSATAPTAAQQAPATGTTALSTTQTTEDARVTPPAAAQPSADAQPAPESLASETVEGSLPPAGEQVPVAKDDLVMPAEAVKMGSTKFLNGSWRVIVGGKNPITGKPPSLRYQIKNGKGTAKITQGDGISCRVDVFAGLMSSGNLVINSRTKARCSDGSRYQMPELICKQSATGPAECSGQYNADTVLPMTMKRESK